MVFRRLVGAGRTQPSMGIKHGKRTTPVLNSGEKIIPVPNTDGPTAGFGAEGIVPAGAGVSVVVTIIIRREKPITRPILQLVKERSIIRQRVQGPELSLI